MATSNRDRVGKALELLGDGLRPFVEREMQAVHDDAWKAEVERSLREPGKSLPKEPLADVYLLLKLMWNDWNTVFRRTLGQAERTYVSELRDARNKWAHQESFTVDDTYRTLDTTERLLTAVSAEQAVEIGHVKQDVMRQRYEEDAKKAKKRAAGASTEGQPAAGLKPWRDLITPHADVAGGTYQQAEFAADLGQVHRGEGSDEYRDPGEFFRRTYLTEGLKDLLRIAIERLAMQKGQPVVGLQTNFGGGKTHSLLALYHLFSGTAAADLIGIEELLKESNVKALPPVNRVVIVGTAVAPGSLTVKGDGTEVHTLWGELAWQLGGAEAYALVADDDRNRTSPGTKLNELFERFGPSLILIDEWVAYARQLFSRDDLEGGSFDTQFTFAQALTEAAAAVDGTLVVVSMPASDIEKGGEGGELALERLDNLLHRKDSPWRPASAEESFEIVRRRLFEPPTDPAARDAVVKAFSELYRSQQSEYPSECRELPYAERMTRAFPIHPEVFARLYDDWSTLETFQRTRGVLRLMAAVIHALWVGGDSNLLILPGTIPLSDPPVQREFTRYLPDEWVPVIDQDVDGEASLPLRMDKENPQLGRLSAARRVARTVFLGSAPTSDAANRGLEEQRVKLGSVQPGENPLVFNDALRRLAGEATFLYQDGRRSWFSMTPTITRTAQNRASQFSEDQVHTEIVRRLRLDRDRGPFVGVHIAPDGPGQVPDDPEARLVVLDPETPHRSRADDSPARLRSADILETKGSGPRRARNMLVFAAADKTLLEELDRAVRSFLAWDSIHRERDELNLDGVQRRQAEERRRQSDETAAAMLRDTYRWLLVPTQTTTSSNVDWQEVRVPAGEDGLALRAGKRLRDDELLITEMAGTRLKLELDKVPLWDDDRINTKHLWELLTQYLYLPRLRDSAVLADAIRDGIARMTWEADTFAYADGYDDKAGRFMGLTAGQQSGVVIDGSTMIVTSGLAVEQLKKERPTGADGDGPDGPVPEPDGDDGDGEALVVPRRFFGTIKVDATRMTRVSADIADAIVQHLNSLPGADVEIRVDIMAEIPEGVPDAVVRTVNENAFTLKFDDFGFEEH
jgi:predicted AAA+ superfamily ATPase